ncbi:MULTISPECIES: CidA/LrgA family protein [Rummeliibacillus]|jgi:holin-like protein|uniref:CidA/LrgA family protein n=1 Tax=Rummeliibacillus TaxID=648802 RepID=UPI001645DF4B|nr:MULTISPECIES: CidA/LrgA family protein [Rummeliibacillus]MBO2536248.1 CidA/LrgA family protein [Rummeliibacillus suwonensis]
MRIQIAKIIVQIIFLYGILLLGDGIAKVSHLPIPGSIIGLVLLFLALQFHIVKLEWVNLGAGLLTSELLLFFVPSAVGVVQYDQIVGIIGIKLVTVIVLSTIVVMACTGLVADFVQKKGAKKV